MICPHCKKENANEYAVTCAYCKNNMYPDVNPEQKAKELSQAQQKDSVFSGFKGILSVILAVAVIVGVILMPKPSFDNNESIPTQNNIETTTQKQQIQNVETTTKTPVVETTTQAPKMSYLQARNWLIAYAKKGTYYDDEKVYKRAIKQYESSSEDTILLLALEYFPDTDTLNLLEWYVTPNYLVEYRVRIQNVETTEMTVTYSSEYILTANSSDTKMATATTTKDTYRPGVNIPCTSYSHWGYDGMPKNHSAQDERKASEDMSRTASKMLQNLDEFLKKQNAGFDLTTLGYKSFYGI